MDDAIEANLRSGSRYAIRENGAARGEKNLRLDGGTDDMRVGPIRQFGSIVSGSAAELRSTAFSMTMHSRPTLMDPLSAMGCAPNRMHTPGPTATSPHRNGVPGFILKWRRGWA